jgi:hypothetical protein
MRGWQFLFLPDVVAPAELPPQIHAYKRQQYRWAKGSTQVLLKLGTQVLTRRGIAPFKRIEGLLHLSGYLMNLLMLALLLTLVPLLALNTRFPDIMVFLSLATFGPVIVYTLSQRALYSDWRARVCYFPVLLLLGTGIALNNSLAVLEAFMRRRNAFRRTPKFHVETESDAWQSKRYALPLTWETFAELSLAAYACVGVAIAWQRHLYWTIPFLILYAASFAFVGGLTLIHSLPVRERVALATAQ